MYTFHPDEIPTITKGEPHVFATVGVPACGKTTWARRVLDANVDKVVRCNKDDIRKMFGYPGYDFDRWSRKNGKKVKEYQLARAREVLQYGISVVVDDTGCPNVDRYTSRWEGIAREFNAKFTLADFRPFTDVQECLKRDARRPEQVGPEVIRKMFAVLHEKKPIHWKAPRPNYPDAVIIDLDGTLSLFGPGTTNNRSPYDAKTCNKDMHHPGLLFFIERMLELRHPKVYFIFLSGRSSVFVNETHEFLDKIKLGNVPITSLENFRLFMRKAGDERVDWKVKKEIYENKVEPLWNVRMVFDDRPQVIRMWRTIGLPTFSAGPLYEF